MNRQLRTKTGRELNEKWNVNAQHALYSKNGHWYNRLDKFPGALFDDNGYIVFKTEIEYLNCSQLQVKKQTNCPQGISSIPGYIPLNSDVEQASDLDEPKDTVRALSVTSRIVRDTPRARKVKDWHNHKCQICAVNLQLFNGRNYAEAHHIKPLGAKHADPDIEKNIICVCPNCHAQLDYGAVKINKSSLRIVSEHEIADEYIDYHNIEIYKGSPKFS